MPVPCRPVRRDNKSGAGPYNPYTANNAHKRHFLPLQTNEKEGIMTVGAKIFAVWESHSLLHRDVRGYQPFTSCLFLLSHPLFYNMTQNIARAFLHGQQLWLQAPAALQLATYLNVFLLIFMYLQIIGIYRISQSH